MKRKPRTTKRERKFSEDLFVVSKLIIPTPRLGFHENMAYITSCLNLGIITEEQYLHLLASPDTFKETEFYQTYIKYMKLKAFL